MTNSNLQHILDPDFRAVCERVVEQMDAVGIPGVAVGVWHAGTAHVAGFGVTNVDHPLPVTDDALFQIGSITKTFVGTAAMRLVEQGRLDLDAPIRVYLPDLRMTSADVAAQVTMRHLLTHTGGWLGDYFDDFGAGDDALARMVAQVGTLPQETPLGALFSYNNAGFYLAGRVIEIITGQTFEDALRELVLDPLDLPMSFLFPSEVMTRRFVVGHHVTDGKAEVVRPWEIGRAAHAAGGITSTVPDLLRYARFHLHNGQTDDGQQLLCAAAVEQMRAPQVPGGSGYDAIGVTWLMRQVKSVWIVGHSGGTNGQSALLTLVPEHDFAMIVLTNANQGGQLNSAVTKAALQHYLGLDDVDPQVLDTPPQMLEAYVGRYSSALADLDMRLEKGGLMIATLPKGGFPKKDSPALSGPPPAPAALYAKDRLIVTSGPMKGARAEFGRDDNGDVAWMRLGARVRRREKN